MRKSQLLGMILVLCVILTSCSQKTNGNNNSDSSSLINAVNQVEKYDYKLNTFQITYDDYKSNTQLFMTSGYSRDDEVIFVDAEKEYKGKDLEGMPLSDLKDLGIKIQNEVFGTTEIKKYTVDISGVYNDDSSKFRYVFTRQTREMGNLGATLYKKYSFLEENNVWKIFSIDKTVTANESPNSLGGKLSPYSSFNNKPVNYIQTIDMLKLK